MEPKLLIQSGFVRLAKGVLAAPSKPTCQGHVIDYFVVSESLRQSVVAVSTLEDSPFCPHSPVRLLLEAAPRKQLMRVQVKPQKIEARFPQGCLNRYSDEWHRGKEEDNIGSGGKEAKGLDETYKEWLGAAEQVWEDLEGEWKKRARKKESKAPRSEGAKFIWVPATGKPAINAGGGNRTLIEWLAIARHLRAVYVATGGTTFGPRWRHGCNARSRLRHMALRRTDGSEVAKRQEWICSMIRSEEWVTGELLGYMEHAMSQAQKERKRVNEEIHRDWMTWINSGPAKGLGRQHRFIRLPEGWAPNTVGKPKEAMDKEGMEMQDKEDRWRRTVEGRLGNERAPLGMQAETGAQAEGRGGRHQWRSMASWRANCGQTNHC